METEGNFNGLDLLYENISILIEELQANVYEAYLKNPESVLHTFSTGVDSLLQQIKKCIAEMRDEQVVASTSKKKENQR